MSDSEGENSKNPKEETNDVEENSDSEGEENKNEDSSETEYEGGAIKKQIITKSSSWETPKKGADVSVHYVGTLLDGTKFDSSRDRNEPFKFKLGQGSVIKGWDKGVATMKKGEKSLFTIAASHAYGESGSPPKIPANATLQFEIELISWTSEEDVTSGGEVKKTVISEGKGWDKPDELAKCTVKYSCQVGGKYVIGGETPEEAVLELSSVDVPEGVVEALKKMKKGERATVRVASEYGYGNAGDAKLQIPANADLVYDIELVDFPDGPKTYSMKNDEKVAHGNKLKEAGNAFFKKDQFKRARHFYGEASKLFEHEKNLEGAVKKQVDQLSVATKGNLAACALKQGDFAETVKVSTEVLALDPENVKVLFRRAQAYHQRKDYDEALEDLKTIIEKEGKTTAVVGKLLKEVKAEVAKERNAQAKIYGGMFNKISLVSDREIAEAKKAAEKKPAVDSSSDDDEPPAMDAPDKQEGSTEIPAETQASPESSQDEVQPSKAETKTVPKVEPTKPKETKPEPKKEKQQKKSESNKEKKPESKTETKPEPKTETKPEPKTEAKLEPKTETIPEPKSESQADSSADGANGDEELTPEQAAAMAAMNEELFGICEEGQAGLAVGSDAKPQDEAPVTVHTNEKTEPKPTEQQTLEREPKVEEPKTDVGKGKKAGAKPTEAESSKSGKQASAQPTETKSEQKPASDEPTKQSSTQAVAASEPSGEPKAVEAQKGAKKGGGSKPAADTKNEKKPAAKGKTAATPKKSG